MRKALAVALSLAALVLVASPAAAQAPADLRAAMAVIVCATLGIVVAGALTPRDRPVRKAAQ